MVAKLRVIRGPFSGQTIQVSRGKLLIGRAEDCDLRPDSAFVSTHHCVLLLDDYTLRIRDLGSTNGTFVNGLAIGAKTMILVQDDMVSIGEMSLLIDLTETTPGTQPVDSEGQPEVSATALEQTGIFEGDTVQVHRPAVIPALPDSIPAPPSVLPPASDPVGPPPQEDRNG